MFNAIESCLYLNYKPAVLMLGPPNGSAACVFKRRVWEEVESWDTSQCTRAALSWWEGCRLQTGDRIHGNNHGRWERQKKRKEKHMKINISKLYLCSFENIDNLSCEKTVLFCAVLEAETRQRLLRTVKKEVGVFSSAVIGKTNTLVWMKPCSSSCTQGGFSGDP